MADEDMDNMIKEVDLDDESVNETVTLILQDDVQEKHSGNGDAKPQVSEAEDSAADTADMAVDDEEPTTEEPMQDQSQGERADGTEAQPQVQDDDSKEPKPECGPLLFIGGLHYMTRDKDLREHFEKYGQLKECRIAKTTQRYGCGSKGRTRGFGFVTMATLEQTEVLLKDAHEINGKIVQVNVSKPNDAHASERRLRISLFDLDKDKTTRESLMTHFGQFGNVSYCTLSMERVDGKTVSQGTGFIDMATEEEMQTVLNRNVDGHQMIDGKSVLVKRTQDSFRRLWFGGLDREKTTKADVLEHFSTFGTVKECVIARDPPATEGEEGRSKGYGFLSMSILAETGAILKHQEEHRIHDKVLVFNRTLQKPNQPDLDVPLIKYITVSGLKDTRLTVDDLSLYFNSHGRARYVNMEKGKNTAIVGFDFVEDAEKVAQMRDHYVFKFWLTVEKADAKTVQLEKDMKKANIAKERNERGRPKAYHNSDRRQGAGYGKAGSTNDGRYGPRQAGPAGRGGGGWVFVDNLYGQREDSFQRPTRGFRGKWQQHSSLDQGGSYGNRNKRRGRGRPY